MAESEASPQIQDTSIQLELDRADIAVAQRFAMENACTIYDAETDTYRYRSVKETTIAEIGEYGVGMQLYFDFLKKISVVMFVMAILGTPLLAINYNGDFAGFTASFFAKTTIGNIGVCGQYGELCPGVTSYPYRSLMSGVGAMVRRATPYLGSIAAISTATFGVFLLAFYYWLLPRMTRLHDERHLTPTDYAVEVDLLPKRLDTARVHLLYSELLKAHFEKVAGEEGSVVEVALARDYGGAIRKFLNIHGLEVEIAELQARAKRAYSERHEQRIRTRIAKLEAERDGCVKAVQREAIIDENSRAVCKAFVIFTETRFRDRVLEAYSWTSRTWLFRFLQPWPLRFGNRAIRVLPTTEPANVYHENLDLPRKERIIRRSLTMIASLVVLVVAAILLLIAQTFTRTGGSVGVGEKSVWVISNATQTTGMCFESCGYSFYSDPTCTTEITDKLVGVMDSSGVYTPGGGLLGKTGLRQNSSSTCTMDSVWRSDRCTSVSAWNGYWRADGTAAGPAPIPSSARRLLEETVAPVRRSSSTYASVIRSVALEIGQPLPRIGGGYTPPGVPPASSVICANECPVSAGPDLHICRGTGTFCDGTWNCLDGSDEINDADGAACGTTCTSPIWPDQCPSSGRCVNRKSGSCFGECSASSTDTTCRAIKDRVEVAMGYTFRGLFEQSGGEVRGLTAAGMAQCDHALAARVVADNYGGTCMGGFKEKPCCTLEQLSPTDRAALASCSAASVFDDVNAVYLDQSALTYMEAYCRSFDAGSAAGSTGRCGTRALWLLEMSSPSCHAAITYNHLWCECLDDFPLLDMAVVTELETCTVRSDEHAYLGANAGFNHLDRAANVIRLACQREAVQRDDSFGAASNTTTTQVIVATFADTSVSSASVINERLAAVQAGLTQTGTITIWSHPDSAGSVIRVEVNDRTAEGSADVAAAYTELEAAITTQFPLHEAFHIRVFDEPHCGPDAYQCQISRKCIPLTAVCDGIPDCEFPGDDESNDTCEPVDAGECRTDESMCASGDECVPFIHWCDGVKDCTDGSDEDSPDCVVQREVRLVTNSTSELVDDLKAMEYLAFHFSEPVSVQCVALDQPTHSLASVIDVYACEESVVFRAGDGAVMRFPDLNCIKVQTAGLRSQAAALAATQPRDPVLTPSDMVYSVFQPAGIACDPEAASDTCPLATGSGTAFCGPAGACKYRVAGSVAAMAVSNTPVCDLGSPISPQAAELIRQQYMLADGTVNKTLVSELTYRCFCQQQVQYQANSNPLLALPPFDTDIQITCEIYFKKLITDKAVGIGGIAIVAVLNALLTALMYWLSDAERSASLTARASSELWKLFLAQFVNTALLVLIVNAKFYDTSLNFAGLGQGDFVDTTREWFARVGANICVTVLILVFTSTLPALVLELLVRWWQRRSIRQKLTQEAMNDAAQLSEFSLSLRLAQFTNLIAVVIMYSSAMPVMLWIGLLYCGVSFWFDKFVLLRYSKIPPQYSPATMKICLRLMPIAVVLNCLFLIWTMSSQTVFPSDPVSQSWSDAINNGLDEDSLILYITGRLSFSSNPGAYAEYIRTRILDSFRKASFGGVVVLAIVALFFCLLLLRFIWQVTVMAVYKFIGIRLGWMVAKITAKVNQLLHSMALVDLEEEKQPDFTVAKATMEKTRMLHSYELSDHPKYSAAHRAITRVKQLSFAHSRGASKQLQLIDNMSDQDIAEYDSVREAQPLSRPLAPAANDQDGIEMQSLDGDAQSVRGSVKGEQEKILAGDVKAEIHSSRGSVRADEQVKVSSSRGSVRGDIVQPIRSTHGSVHGDTQEPSRSTRGSVHGDEAVRSARGSVHGDEAVRSTRGSVHGDEQPRVGSTKGSVHETGPSGQDAGEDQGGSQTGSADQLRYPSLPAGPLMPPSGSRRNSQ